MFFEYTGVFNDAIGSGFVVGRFRGMNVFMIMGRKGAWFCVCGFSFDVKVWSAFLWAYRL